MTAGRREQAQACCLTALRALERDADNGELCPNGLSAIEQLRAALELLGADELAVRQRDLF